MRNRKLTHTIAAGAAALALASGNLALTAVTAEASQRQNADAAGAGVAKSIKKEDFASSGRDGWKAEQERQNSRLARNIGGQTASNGYRADNGKGVPESQSRFSGTTGGMGGANNPFASRGGCGKPCAPK